MGYTYSRWDGTQSFGALEAGELIEALSDDLVAHGDVVRALQRVVAEGLDRDDGTRLPGLADLRQWARERRHAILDRYRPDSVLEDVDRQLAEIVRAERGALEGSRHSVHNGCEQELAIDAHTAQAESLLDQLPGDDGDAISALHDYEIADVEASPRFDGLRQSLRRHLLERHFESGDACDSFLSALSPDVRRRLEAAVDAVLADVDVGAGLAGLSSTLRAGKTTAIRGAPFAGQGDVPLDEALRVTRAIQDLERLEEDFARVRDTGELASLDVELTTRTLGRDAADVVESLRRLTSVLEEARYVRRDASRTELSARGVRKIGEKALHDIFRHIGGDGFGEHALPVPGTGGDPSDASRPPEFGDPFLLDLNRTLMNAVIRRGPGAPMTLAASDFEMFRPERQTRSATVLMLDMSRSMPLRGCFIAARRVALALNTLIATRFPRDRLFILAFSEFAREVRPEELHHITWGDRVHGTNMQHGFMVARRLLGRFREGSKQIVLITDGEPTAHLDNGQVRFAYPPTRQTFEATLREVKRCTRKGIIINTFMLERSHYLTDFITQMTHINHGRAFFATPERLGEYIVLDYVSRKGQRAVRIR